MLKAKEDKPKKLHSSYPDYDFTYIYKEKTIKILSDILLLTGLLCIAINIIAWQWPFWFPYVIASQITFYFVFLRPFKNDADYLKSVPLSSIVIALFIVFLDVYDYLVFDKVFGWSIAYVAPCVLSFATFLCGIYGLFSKKTEGYCIKGLLTLVILSVAFLLMKLFGFKHLATWPAIMYFAMASGFLALMLIFKTKKSTKEINKSFHI